MANNNELWEELNKIPDPLIDYDNDTDLELETLLKMEWQIQGTELSKYSSASADTYVDASGRYAKKVFNDGFVEFYELA